ncbi:MAG: flap endonuclease-1, partial [Candidatus Aenigmarchaeota archaeon]|nr:flap endonuclease-1 [Candidatus Aenigmarchaeota archaeon]
AGVKPVYIFDGKPPELKRRTISERVEVRAKAAAQWKKAKAAGDLEGARKYAQASSRLTEEIVEDSKRLLRAMGVPFVDAPSEGEAQAAWMAREGKVDFCSSQDYDALLFGAPQLIRNLTVSGRRKLPGKNIYIEVEPELISLEKTLEHLGIEHKQLIWIGILIGTDFNDGVKGIGPKKALKIVKEAKTLADAVEASKGEFEVEPAEVEKLFLHPPVDEKVEVRFGNPDKKELIEFLCKEHDFSDSRVEGVVDAIAKKASEKGEQSSLGKWVK